VKYINSVRGHFSEQAVFSVRDLAIFLSKKRISKEYSYLLLHNLLRKGEIVRVSRGIYSFKKDPVHWGFAFSPFYYGLQESLSLRNLWEQECIPVIITAKRVRPGLRGIAGSNILVRRIQRKAFFGFEMLKHHDCFVPVSDVEKTLLDFCYFREPLPENALKNLLFKADEKKLRTYLQKYPKRFRKTIEKKMLEAKKERK